MRKLFIVSLFVFSALVPSVFSQKVTESEITKLAGTWKVDLRPTPDAAEYFQEFEITQIDAKKFSGKFYGTEVSNGKVNVDWGTAYLVFTSEDGSGIYSHFAKVVGGRLEGVTHGIGRGFVLPWRAERMVKDPVNTPKVN